MITSTIILPRRVKLFYTIYNKKHSIVIVEDI